MFGIWVGSFGWLLGFLLVSPDRVGALWIELLISAAVTAAIAGCMHAILLARPAPSLARVWSAIAFAGGGLLLCYVAVLMPALLGEPALVARLERLGTIVEIPLWPGLMVVAAGACGLLVTRPARRRATGA